MADINLNQYSDKRSYNNLPVPEGQYLAPFLVENWDEVKAMNYHRDNLETWHFSGIPVLVAFTPVTPEQFPGTSKQKLAIHRHGVDVFFFKYNWNIFILKHSYI